VSLGAHARPHERVDVGVSFEAPFTVSGDHRTTGTSVGSPVAGTVETSTDAEIKYPATLSFGATYLPRNVLTTTFSVEFVRRFWENLEDTFLDADGNELGLRDTWDFRVGLEHVFYNDLPLRFGFRYLENYADPESERSIYSVGVGYRIGELRLDVSGLYHRQTSRQDFLFDPTIVVGGTTFPSPNSDTKVEDSILQLVVGVSRGF
jgi:long-subunit fatty acid transport protein